MRIQYITPKIGFSNWNIARNDGLCNDMSITSLFTENSEEIDNLTPED